MSEHPPIPARTYVEACGAVGYDESAEIWPQLEAIIEAAAPVLWREWTRGMAVVPLPEPTRPVAEQWTAGECEDIYWEAHLDADEYGPLIYFEAGERWLGIESTRSFAAALLAAADRAEQLAAEANTETGQP